MDVRLEPGSYVIAVSGGVDSVALLHHLQQQPELQLTVAHFDHGIREDSVADRQLVAQLANQYGLPFVYDEGQLGPNASEATAREARYAFLRKVAESANAHAIITAHHQDDAVETAIINLLRGTGRKGLTALGDTQNVKRPIRHIPKSALIDYAKDQGLVWHDDSTNTDEKYLRNYVRHRLVSRIDIENRQKLLQIIDNLHTVNQELDQLLEEELQIHSIDGVVDRQWFIQLPHGVAREVMATWLRHSEVYDFDRKALERLVVGAKTGRPGTSYDAVLGTRLKVGIDGLALQGNEC